MTLDLQEIVSAFEHHVAVQTDAIWKGDSKTGNKHARLYIEAAQALKRWDEGFLGP